MDRDASVPLDGSPVSAGARPAATLTGDVWSRAVPAWLTGHRYGTAFVGLAVVAFGTILWLGRGLTFFSDEWAVMTRPAASLGDWLLPHNEHWVTLPALAFRAEFAAFGLRTYVPFLALLLMVHVLAAGAVFFLVRRVNGGPAGLVAGGLFLFLGSGFENLYWGFQTTFVGATCAGLWALYALEAGAGWRAHALAAGLLVVAVMCSGAGLFFLAAAGGLLLAKDDRRHRLPWLAIPIAVYGAWYLRYGTSGIAYRRSPFSLAAIADVPRSVAEGLASVTGALFGVGPAIGAAVAVGLVAIAVVRAGRGWRPSSRLVAALAGLVAEYAVIGLVRAELFEGVVNYSRYTYEGVAFGILALSALLQGIRFVDLGRWRRPAIVAALAGLELAAVWNIRLLVEGREIFAQRADMTRAIVELSLAPQPAFDVGASQVDSPTPAEIPGLVARYGSPLTDALAADAVRTIPAETYAAALRRLRNEGGSPTP